MENITVLLVPNTGAVFVVRSYTCWLSAVTLSIESADMSFDLCVIHTILTRTFCSTCDLSPKFHVFSWQDVLNMLVDLAEEFTCF